MTITCPRCQQVYDDAERLTSCPHLRFLSAEERARKVRAMQLMGHALELRGRPDLVRIMAILPTGLVLLQGIDGEFDPADLNEVPL